MSINLWKLNLKYWICRAEKERSQMKVELEDIHIQMDYATKSKVCHCNDIIIDICYLPISFGHFYIISLFFLDLSFMLNTFYKQWIHNKAFTGCLQITADKQSKAFEAQLVELNAKLELSARETQELTAQKIRALNESTENVRQLEEVESQLSQLSKSKVALLKQLEEAMAAIEDEGRLRAKNQSDLRNLQACLYNRHLVSSYTFSKNCRQHL